MTKKVGEVEVTLSIEVDENSNNADKAFEHMHQLIGSFTGADTNAYS